MTVKELMKKLINCDPDDEVRYWDIARHGWAAVNLVLPIAVVSDVLYNEQAPDIDLERSFVGLS